MISSRELLWKLVNRKDVYAVQWNKDGEYYPVWEPVTDAVLDRHERGEITIGAYQLDKKDNVTWGALDHDENTQEDYKQAVREYQLLKEDGYGVILEKSGGGPLRAHVWVLVPSPTPAGQMQAFLKDFCKRHNTSPHEIFPKQRTISDKQLGNLMKLPYGINRKNGVRSEVVEVANL